MGHVTLTANDVIGSKPMIKGETHKNIEHDVVTLLIICIYMYITQPL